MNSFSKFYNTVSITIDYNLKLFFGGIYIKKNILFVIFTIYFCFLLITILIFWRGFSLYQLKLSNNFISSDAIYFSLNSEDNKDVITYLNNKLQKFTLYNKIYEDENKAILSILYNDKSIHPILEEGRYFTKTDFFSNKKVAVIGKDILNTNYVIEKNNSIYFLFYNEIFEVIGIMNYGHGTSMNKTVFVNMDSVINKLNNIFCIDGNKEEVKKTIDDLTNKYFINLLSFQKSILNKILDLYKIF